MNYKRHLDELNAILLEFEEQETEKINDAIHALQNLKNLQDERIRELKVLAKEMDENDVRS
jgi:hypothetical protein